VASDKPPLEYRQLTVDELREMESGGMDIANHSATHPMFDKIDRVVLERELDISYSFFKTYGFTHHDVIAYPNGNYSGELDELLDERRVRIAFLFDHAVNKGYNKRYQVSRLSVNDTTPMWKFRFILSGWHSKVLPFTKEVARMRTALMK
jgi:peptidoglycan/xylan/chitin deacetylase (PgdA/CDA1 family)